MLHTPKIPKFDDARIEPYVSVIVPALNEVTHIADVVRYALSDPATAEVIVIDDCSIDETVERARAAGARVYPSTILGKGASMRDGLDHAKRDIVVFLDGDLSGLRPGIIADLCAPLVTNDADFVKARFGRGGGRVTELTAKPMLKIFFPELAHFAQPLGGIIAARKSLLCALAFEEGYGVDVGLLIDAWIANAKIAEVDIGSLMHDSQPLLDLTFMANEIGRVIFTRAKSLGRLHVEQISAMYELQRHAAAGIDYVLERRKNRQRLLLLDMDDTVTPTQFSLELARIANLEPALTASLQSEMDDEGERATRIAQVFKYVHKTKFEQVAHALPIRPGVIEFVRQMRRAGFMVGLVSHSYFVAAEIVRRRIYADFAMAHMIQFENDVCAGEVRINPAFFDSRGSQVACKSNVLRRFLADVSQPPVKECWVVGNDRSDAPLMRLANRTFALNATAPELLNDPHIEHIASFDALLDLVRSAE